MGFENSHSQYITDTFKCTMCNSNLFIDPYQNINDAQLTAAIQASLDKESLCRGIKEVETVAETARTKLKVQVYDQGKCTNASGSTYVGDWKDGKKHGQGAFTYADGETYVGGWKEDKKHGQGTCNWANGMTYVGERIYGKMHGHGTYTYVSGDTYVGDFEEDKKHGQGTYTYAGGETYVGDWKDDKMHGQGTHTYASTGTTANVRATQPTSAAEKTSNEKKKDKENRKQWRKAAIRCGRLEEKLSVSEREEIQRQTGQMVSYNLPEMKKKLERVEDLLSSDSSDLTSNENKKEKDADRVVGNEIDGFDDSDWCNGTILEVQHRQSDLETRIKAIADAVDS